MKRLAGRTDLEDALKKLDRLTQEEARMAVAENLRVTHSVRDEVKMVDGKVESVGGKIEDVRDKVEDIGDKVEDIGDKVEDIGDKVQSVDEKVQVVIDGAQLISSSPPLPPNILLSDSKQVTLAASEAKIILQQTASSVDEIKCS